MKVLLIADREELKHFLEKELALRGAQLVHYWHPIKAMDNIEEMAPELIIFSGRDFPRHWKPFLVYFRAYSPRAESVPFILLHGEAFPGDEKKKALHLKVDAVIPEEMAAEDIQKLKGFILSGRNASYRPSAAEKADILFTHPGDLTLVQGRIEEISAAALSFFPLDPELCDALRLPAVVRGCSLSIFGSLIEVDIEITEKDGDSFRARLLSGHEKIAPYI
jgi:hypothetical protein